MKKLLARATFFVRYAWVFSFFINLTLLLSPLYLLQVYDRVLTSRSLPTLTMLTIGVSVAYLIYIGLEVVRSRLLVQAGLALDEILASSVLDKVFEKSAQIGGAQHAGAIRDVAVLRQYLTGNGLFAFLDAPWGVAFLLIIFVIHWVLGAIALFGMLLLLVMALIDDRRTRPLLQEANSRSRETGRYIDAAIRNAEAIETLGMRSAVVDRWGKRNLHVLVAQSAASDRSGATVAASKGVRLLLQTAMLGTGAYLVIAENLSAGTMIAATILLGKATAPLELAISGWRGFVEARAAYARLDALLDANGVVAPVVELPEPKGALSVDRVVFGAKPGQPPILKGVTFSLDPGECLAIIGHTAAGKSTLVRVLLGLWRPQSGSVRLDGASISEWPRNRLAPFVGYLPQDTELLTGTVADNIARMADGADQSDAVVRAAKMAGAHDMILQLANGYDTEIGLGGLTLSGGQRQRIGLARALFGSPRFIVLDEPNSNLDSEGELALIEAMKAIKAMGSTLVFVTHKPALMIHADKVLVLGAG
ncbi:MAG: type I secretion system permease/ATPase, partial [Halioglobus sp.]|nr:type I secretion system permease/ATPase [Halioglobus sp.]